MIHKRKLVCIRESVELERSCDPVLAEKILTKWVLSEGLVCESSYDNPNYQVVRVALKNSRSGFVCDGFGKGAYYLLGGLAEAVEHYFSLSEARQGSLELALESKDIATQEAFCNCNIMQTLGTFPTEAMQVVCYYSWPWAEKCCAYVPAIFVNPLYIQDSTGPSEAQKYLARYSYSTGFALGLTLEDALLHALNENIERHYLSHFYLHVLPNQETLFEFSELDQVSLRESFREATDFLDKHYQWKILISKEDSMGGVVFSMVIGNRTGPLKHEFPLSVIGLGASLYGEVAVQRSISEFLQGHFPEQSELDQREKDIYGHLKNLSHVKGLIDLMGVKTLARMSWHDFRRIRPPVEASLSTRRQLDHMVNGLHKSGYNTLYRIMTKQHDPFYVVHVLVPGFERFHLMREGNFVAPQSWLKKIA